jgi:hypothetical protein
VLAVAARGHREVFRVLAAQSMAAIFPVEGCLEEAEQVQAQEH